MRRAAAGSGSRRVALQQQAGLGTATTHFTLQEQSSSVPQQAAVICASTPNAAQVMVGLVLSPVPCPLFDTALMWAHAQRHGSTHRGDQEGICPSLDELQLHTAKPLPG